ncbi:MAG: hypothetical protein ACJA2Q_002272 [Pseudohongiellaceae bacterium]|jgi:hypothetical protein
MVVIEPEWLFSKRPSVKTGKEFGVSECAMVAYIEDILTSYLFGSKAALLVRAIDG